MEAAPPRVAVARSRVSDRKSPSANFRRRGRIFGTCLVAAIAVARVGLAEERAELLAEAAFAEGVKLMHADHCSEAVAKFEESQRLDPASGTALNLAYCDSRLGRIASAWLTYRQAITLAQAQGKPEHLRIAKTEAEKLEPDLPHLTLLVPTTSGVAASVELDAEPLPREAWSTPFPIDPGSHGIVVRVNGASVWQKTLTIARREHLTIRVPPESVVSATGSPAEPSRSEPTAEHRAAAQPNPSPAPRDAQRTWAFVFGGVGAAAIVTGAALFASARLQYDGVADHCPGNACDDEGFDARTSAAGRAKASYVVLGAGTALLGTGVVLLLTDDDGATAATAVTMGATGGDASVSFRGVF